MPPEVTPTNRLGNFLTPNLLAASRGDDAADSYQPSAMTRPILP
jgi:hypothetical protein